GAGIPLSKPSRHAFDTEHEAAEAPPGAMTSEGVEPYPPKQGRVPGVVADRIETWVNTQEDEPGGVFIDRDVEPSEGFVHVAESGVKRGDAPSRDHAMRAGLDQ